MIDIQHKRSQKIHVKLNEKIPHHSQTQDNSGGKMKKKASKPRKYTYRAWDFHIWIQPYVNTT